MISLAAVFEFSLFNRAAAAMDRVVAGICGYLILALLWRTLYSIHEHLQPDGFQALDGQPVLATPGLMVYFSLVTLSTVGYGDIVPVSPIARILAGLEGVAGTLYPAVLIATLVSELRRNPS